MTVQDALQLYKIPYIISETKSGAGFTLYKLTPAGSSATPQKIKQYLKAIQQAAGVQLDIIDDTTALYLRSTEKQPIYKYFDYAGYIDYKSPKIPFIVGFKDGQLLMDDIDSARHLLIAGTTGSGKSVFLHNLITTFCCNENNFIYLVDCKKVEFSIYKDHAVIASEVFGEISAARIVNTMIERMERRFSDMERAGVNDFLEYKNINPGIKRYILVIDELSDLIGDKRARAVLIPGLLRIAQKGRAAGFHIILATQRPDSSVINGTLKGNLPTRCAFRTISNIDSRIILDQSGAEYLKGNGDGLYLRNGSFNIDRFQAPLITLDDIRGIA